MYTHTTKPFTPRQSLLPLLPLLSMSIPSKPLPPPQKKKTRQGSDSFFVKCHGRPKKEELEHV